MAGAVPPGLDDTMRRVIQYGGAQDLEQIGTDIDLVRLLRNTMDPMAEFGDATDKINAEFDEMAKRASMRAKQRRSAAWISVRRADSLIRFFHDSPAEKRGHRS